MFWFGPICIFPRFLYNWQVPWMIEVMVHLPSSLLRSVDRALLTSLKTSFLNCKTENLICCKWSFATRVSCFKNTLLHTNFMTEIEIESLKRDLIRIFAGYWLEWINTLVAAFRTNSKMSFDGSKPVPKWPYKKRNKNNWKFFRKHFLINKIIRSKSCFIWCAVSCRVGTGENPCESPWNEDLKIGFGFLFSSNTSRGNQ